MSSIKKLRSGTSPSKDPGNSDLNGVQVHLQWDDESRIYFKNNRDNSPSGAKEE